jgi:hypothetical protein
MARGNMSISSSSDDRDSDSDAEDNSFVDELAHVVIFLRMFSLNKRLN